MAWRSWGEGEELGGGGSDSAQAGHCEAKGGVPTSDPGGESVSRGLGASETCSSCLSFLLGCVSVALCVCMSVCLWSGCLHRGQASALRRSCYRVPCASCSHTAVSTASGHSWDECPRRAAQCSPWAEGVHGSCGHTCLLGLGPGFWGDGGCWSRCLPQPHPALLSGEWTADLGLADGSGRHRPGVGGGGVSRCTGRTSRVGLEEAAALGSSRDCWCQEWTPTRPSGTEAPSGLSLVVGSSCV